VICIKDINILLIPVLQSSLGKCIMKYCIFNCISLKIIIRGLFFSRDDNVKKLWVTWWANYTIGAASGAEGWIFKIFFN
jgi:hypothetical protein